MFRIFKENIKIRDVKEKIKARKLKKITINKFKKYENTIKKNRAILSFKTIEQSVFKIIK